MNTWFGIWWTQPENIKYFFIFAFAAAFMAYRWMRSAQLIAILGKTVHGIKFLHNTSYARITVKSILWLTALFFIFLTLLHPSWNTKEEKVIQEGRDLFIALDISRSMLAQDITPSRLEFAKQKITALVNALPSERIGLILFSGSSFVQCPLTRDRNAFFMYLNQIDVDTIASGTTAIDQALGQALAAFKQGGTQKNKLLVIFTDGEDFSSNLASYKQEAQQQGLTIFTIGIGTEQGAPIPLFDQYAKQSGHLKDRNGNVVISKLNEGILQNLAHDLGGIYIHASKDTNDLRQLVQLVQNREKEMVEERTMAQREEQYPWFLLVSFILLGIEWLL
jgi:Ca-activated chloride channel homolog